MDKNENTMKAYVLKEGGGIELRQMPVPNLGDYDVLVKITKASVCGTDYQIVKWDAWTQENEVPAEIILGHEGAGIVEKIGSKVTRVKLGDFVAMESHYVEHDEKDPENEGVIGVFGPKDSSGKRIFPRHGTFAAYCCNDEKSIYKLSDKSKNSIHASLLEPAGNGWKVARWIQDAGITENIVVFGAGLHGTNTTLFLKELGIKNIILLDPNQIRRNFAEKFGVVDHIIDPTQGDFKQKILELTNNAVNCVVDMAGPKIVFDSGIELLKENGLFVLFGLPKEAGREVDGKKLNDIIFGNQEFDSEINGKRIHFKGIAGRTHQGWLELTARLEKSEFLQKKISETLTKVIPMENLAEEIMNADKSIMKLGMNGFK
ncbi:MAG: alcohol dehydrogenase catalytic domain-containing protein [Candidatus Diapherotrites archaeon]